MNNPNYSTVKQFAAKNPAFTESALRYRIFHESSNGLAESRAITRIGRRVLINEGRFFEWLENQNNSTER